jgi:hypothetical protein
MANETDELPLLDMQVEVLDYDRRAFGRRVNLREVVNDEVVAYDLRNGAKDVKKNYFVY